MPRTAISNMDSSQARSNERESYNGMNAYEIENPSSSIARLLSCWKRSHKIDPIAIHPAVPPLSLSSISIAMSGMLYRTNVANVTSTALSG